MTTTITIPAADGSLVDHRMGPAGEFPVEAPPVASRVVYAAVHVVADPLRSGAGNGVSAVDWDATLRQRLRTWRLGLGVAEAMDTAQRGMGLDWEQVRTLTTRTLEAGREVGGRTVVGVATDQLAPGRYELKEVVDAYLEQLDHVESLGGTAVVMASRHLAAAATSPDDYVRVYDAVLGAARRPVVLHWLGSAFDAELEGYWGSTDLDRAADVVTDLLRRHASVVDGIKVSLLDAARERALRLRAPAGVRIYTGDDFNYPELIATDPDGSHSDALLGAFAAVAPIARAAFARLDDGDEPGFRALLDPTVPLSRTLFEAPTRYYKTGIAWLAYLQGQQSHFRMLGGLEAGRDIIHLATVFRQADAIGLFHDPDLAASRMAGFLSVHGIA
jgi:hypothetical protein